MKNLLSCVKMAGNYSKFHVMKDQTQPRTISKQTLTISAHIESNRYLQLMHHQGRTSLN